MPAVSKPNFDISIPKSPSAISTTRATASCYTVLLVSPLLSLSLPYLWISSISHAEQFNNFFWFLVYCQIIPSGCYLPLSTLSRYFFIQRHLLSQEDFFFFPSQQKMIKKKKLFKNIVETSNERNPICSLIGALNILKPSSGNPQSRPHSKRNSGVRCYISRDPARKRETFPANV